MNWLFRSVEKERNFEKKELSEILQCPITRTPLRKINEGYENIDPNKKVQYKVLNDIPILVSSDAILVETKNHL